MPRDPLYVLLYIFIIIVVVVVLFKLLNGTLGVAF